jgi:hypothetical protein
MSPTEGCARWRALCGRQPDGYELVSRFRPPITTEVETLSVLVECPPGKKMLSAGGSINHNSVEDGWRTSVSMIRLDENGRQATIAGRDDAVDGDPTSAFRLTGRAVCANATALVGHEVVTGPASPQSSARSVTRRAECPQGKFAYGSGMFKVDDTGHTYLDGATPQAIVNKRPGRFNVRTEQAMPLVPWSLRAHVVCAN